MIKSALNLIKALGGNGATGMCKCPAHDDKRPSLHVTERSGRTLFKCHAGCSQEAVIVALKALGLWTSLTEGVAPPSSRTDEHSEQYERFRKAFMILRRAADRKAGNGSSYFQRRGIKAPPPCAMILPAQDSDHFTGKRFPALVLPIINDGKLQGAHLTWLNKSATAKLEVRDDKPRRIFGIEKSGFIPLAAPDPSRSLIIGEGVETTLAAMQLAGLPGIAAISATNMPTIQPPRAEGGGAIARAAGV